MEPVPETPETFLANLANYLRPDEPWQTILIVCAVLLAGAMWATSGLTRIESSRVSRNSTSSGVVFLLVWLGIGLTLVRHIAQLIGVPHSSIDVFLIFNFVALAFASLLTSTGGFRFSVWIAAAVAPISIFRFSKEGSPLNLAVINWLAEYFPYKEVEPKSLATGLLAFILVGGVSYHNVHEYNMRQKEKVLRNRSVGIDPAAIEKLSVVIAIIAGLLVGMVATGVNLPTITLATGVLAAGIAYAAKDILSNIAAGVVLIWDGTFKIDDVISIEGGGYGWIDKFTLRHAVIKDRNDVSILIPYTRLIGSTIQNWTHDGNRVRLKIDIGVDYETKNLGTAKEAILKAARNVERVIKDSKPPKVTVIAAAESAIHLQLRFWISDPKNGIRNVMSDVLEGMISELRLAGVKIPFNTVDVNLIPQKDEPSKPRAKNN